MKNFSESEQTFFQFRLGFRPRPRPPQRARVFVLYLPRCPEGGRGGSDQDSL